MVAGGATRRTAVPDRAAPWARPWPPTRRPVPLLLVVLLLAGSAAPDWTDCPEPCRCKWTSGKKTALCPNAGISTVPTALNPDMQVRMVVRG